MRPRHRTELKPTSSCSQLVRLVDAGRLCSRAAPSFCRHNSQRLRHRTRARLQWLQCFRAGNNVTSKAITARHQNETAVVHALGLGTPEPSGSRSREHLARARPRSTLLWRRSHDHDTDCMGKRGSLLQLLHRLRSAGRSALRTVPSASSWEREGGNLVGRHFDELGSFTGGDFLSVLSRSDRRRR